jgi:mono/diheme cytochrome c family protein
MRTADILFSLAVVLHGAGCNMKFPASMEDQPAVKPLSLSRPAPEGSVPVGGVEMLEAREDAEDQKNPIPVAAADIPAGARLFKDHCVACHGAEGHGGGKVSAKFPPAPDLRYQTICRRSDGFIYGTITAGGRAMPSMRDGLTSHERWVLEMYVRHIQKDGCIAPPPSPTEEQPQTGNQP